MIGCHGNNGQSGVNLNDTIRLREPENPLFGANSLYVSSTVPKLQLFKVPIWYNAIFHFWVKIGKTIFLINETMKRT